LKAYELEIYVVFVSQIGIPCCKSRSKKRKKLGKWGFFQHCCMFSVCICEIKIPSKRNVD
jgi:hypothetical protein